MEQDRYHRKQHDVVRLDSAARRSQQLVSGNGVEYQLKLPTPDQALHTLLEARKARTHAESYRGFSVGACATALAEDGQTRITKHGANFKNEAGTSSIDIHAEALVLQSLRSKDYVSILAIVGQAQPDHGSGLHSPTLHPCIKCRQMLHESEHISDSSLLICATPDGTAVEWGILSDFEAFHSGTPHNLEQALFDDIPSVFRPLPAMATYDTRDLRLDIPTNDWDEKVTFPLLRRIYDL